MYISWEKYKSNRKYNIIAVGRLERCKNFNILIESVKDILQEKDMRLIIIGDGEERKNLQEMIDKYKLNNYIKLTGFLDNPYPYMKKSNILVLPSSIEGFGNVLVEGMACGCQLISTVDSGGPKEILDNGKYGRLVKSNDIDGLRNSILETMNSPIHPSLMNKRCEDFKSFNITQKYLSTINEL